MTILRNTTPEEVDITHGRVRSPATKDEIRAVTRNQAMTKERLTNQNADGAGGAPESGNEGHAHNDGDKLGNRLWRAVMSQGFGDERWMDTTNSPYRSEHRPLTVKRNAATEAEVILEYFPFFTSAIWGEEPMIMVVKCTEPGGAKGADPVAWATLQDSSLNNVSAWTRMRFKSAVNATSIPELDMINDGGSFLTVLSEHPQADKLWFVVFENGTGAGLQAMKIEAAVADDAGDREFQSIGIFPAIGHKRRYGGDLTRKPNWDYVGNHTNEPNNVIQVGDPENSNGFHEVDTALLDDDIPAGAALTLMVQNDAYIQERAFDIPTQGNRTAAVRGHDHSGTGELGAPVDQAMGAWCFGSFNPRAEIVGCNSKAPGALGNTSPGSDPIGGGYTTVYVGRVQIPTTALTTAGTSGCKCAVLVYSPTGCNIDVKAVLGSTNVVFNSGTSGYQLLVMGTTLALSSGALSNWRIGIKDPNAKGTYNAALLGACLYLEY